MAPTKYVKKMQQKLAETRLARQNNYYISGSYDLLKSSRLIQK